MDRLFSFNLSLTEVILFLILGTIFEMIWLFWPSKRKGKQADVDAKTDLEKPSLDTFSLKKIMSYKKIWKWLTIVSWIVFLVTLFMIMLKAWTVPYPLDIWIIVASLVIALLITGMPLLIALFRPGLRKKLFSSPGMVASILFIGTFFLSLILLVIMGMLGIIFLVNAESNNFLDVILWVLMGYLIGIIAFPLTFGLVFPLAIPIICALIVRSTLDKHHKMSRWGWSLAIVISTFGWMLVSLVGFALGQA